MSEDKLPPVVARNRARNSLRRKGYASPFPTSPPVVVWRATECRCRVLSVYLSPEGWHMDGAAFYIPVDEWARRVGGDAEMAAAILSGEVPTMARDRRRVKGFTETFPLDLTEWSHGKFQIGCRHGHGWASTRDLLADCQQAKACRVRVDRPVMW